ncbi:hypothetical protein ZWY2020_020513 [Hordeum vulgare]|nr:hypothetical protein ZWY2020_020513 [Hordeum vulgare]
MAGGGLSGGAAAFWTTGALEVVKQNDSPGLLWKRIKLTTTHKNNAKKRLLAGFDLLGAGPTAPSKPSAHTRQLVAAMQQHTSNLADLVENLLTRFDEEKLAAEKCMEIQAAFNTHVSHELQSPSKQIGLPSRRRRRPQGGFPLGLADSARQIRHNRSPHATAQGWAPATRAHATTRATCCPARECLTNSTRACRRPTFARLVNEGPPVMARPEQAERTHLQNPREEYFTKPPKHDFP